MPALTDGLYGSAGSGELQLSTCSGAGVRVSDAPRYRCDSGDFGLRLYRVLKDFNQMGKL